MFQLKDFLSIVAAEVNLVRGLTETITDFRPGSVVRTLLEAPAAELEELYLRTFQGIIDAIPVAIYGAFAFERQPAQVAYGYLTFSRPTSDSQSHVVAAGTRVQTADGIAFATVAEATLAANALAVSVMAQCTTAGRIGNVDAGRVNVLVNAVDGITSVTNLSAMAHGEDQEDDSQRRLRFHEYIATLTRGTRAALIYGAKLAQIMSNGLVTERVAQARCLEYDDDATIDVGTALVVIYNGLNTGTTGASTALIAEAQTLINGANGIPGWKSAGIVVTVLAALLFKVNLRATVTIAPTTDQDAVRSAILEAWQTYFAGLGIGDTVVRAELIAGAMGIDGVNNIQVTAPSSDIAVTFRHVATLGTTALTMVIDNA